jgi:hypothetical protein
MSSSLSKVFFSFLSLSVCNRHTLIVADSLLTDMNRLLIHSNGTVDGYTSSVASTAATAALTHAAASVACAAAPAALNGSGDGPGSGGGSSSGGNPSGNNNDVRRLQDEVNQLTKRNGGNPSPIQLQFCFYQTHLVLLVRLCLSLELMQQLSRAEQTGKEMSALMKKDFELSEGEKSQKIKEMEKSQRQWKQEKDELVRVLFSIINQDVESKTGKL